VLANIFELVPLVNSIRDKQVAVTVIPKNIFEQLKSQFNKYLVDIFGLKDELQQESNKLDGVLQLLADIRNEAKLRKDFTTSDKIRNQLLGMGIQMKDEKGGGVSWTIEK
jgi:cysteinyl-tRNA synthetase